MLSHLGCENLQMDVIHKPVLLEKRSLFQRLFCNKPQKYPSISDRHTIAHAFAENILGNPLDAKVPEGIMAFKITHKNTLYEGNSYLEYVIVELAKLLKEYIYIIKCGCGYCYRDKNYIKCSSIIMVFVKVDQKCLVCAEKSPSILFDPCNHTCCSKCTYMWRVCPVCKKDIHRRYLLRIENV